MERHQIKTTSQSGNLSKNNFFMLWNLPWMVSPYESYKVPN